jgi:glucosylceramidase
MSQNNKNNDDKGPRIFTKQTSLLLGASGPMMLLFVLAFMRVPIAGWMVAVAAVASISMLVSAVLSARGSSEEQSVAPTPVIDGITTTQTKKHAPIEPISWRDKVSGIRGSDIVVMSANKRQPVLGFGAALTGSACKVLDLMPKDKKDAEMRNLFSADEMNLNVCRTSIGSSDYSPELYSYADEVDPELKNFSIDRDRPHVLPVLKAALAINPELFLFSSPWSPPGWMKPSGTMLGGEMDGTFLDVYADYFVRFIKAYEAEGIPIQAVTIQNEVETDQGGRMPACIWTKDVECDFVKFHLGPTFAMANLDHVRIWMIDHNFDLEKRAIDTLNDEWVAEFCDGIAWHGYGGSADAVSRVHDAHPDAEHHFTEFNTFIDAPQYMTDHAYWGRQVGEAMRNWIRDYVMWNVALDEQGKPNIGPFTCGGVITVDSKTGDVLRSGGYWGLGHYSKFVRRGAWCVESNGTVEGLTHVAFRNPDGGMVLVITNDSAVERTITIEHVGNADAQPRVADVRVEADSVTTLCWR